MTKVLFLGLALIVTISVIACDSADTPLVDRFGVDSGESYEAFFASDISADVERGVKETLDAATKAWGSSGRLEYWVVGTDPKATIDLAHKFCDRRVKNGDMDQEECVEDAIENQDHSFNVYREIGEEALSSGRPRGNAGHNGGAEWGFHRMTSSLPLGFAGQLGVPGEDEQVTVLHEYWHSIQHSFIETTSRGKGEWPTNSSYVPGDRTRDSLLGPIWFQEGSAVAMAEMTHQQLRSEGELSVWDNGEWEWRGLEDRMSSKMAEAQDWRHKCPPMSEVGYGSSCTGPMGYEAGSWAVLFLMNQFGHDVLISKFHPVVEQLTWEGAFSEVFGMTSSDFYDQFDAFLDLSLNEQVKILN